MIFRFLFILSLTILLSANTVYPDNNKNHDALKQKVKLYESKTKKGIAEIELLKEIAEGYLNKSPYHSLTYSHEALKLSKQQGFVLKIADSYNHIGKIYQKQGIYDLSLEYYLNALEIFEREEDVEAVAWSNVDVGNCFFALEQYDEARGYYENAIILFKQYDKVDDYGIATSLNNIGLIFNETAKYDSSLVYFNEVLKIRKRGINKEDIALSYMYLGNTHKLMKDYESALVFYYEANEIYNNISVYDGKANTLKSIAHIHLAKNEYDKALEALKTSNLLYYKAGDSSEVANNYIDIAQLYLANNNNEEAIKAVDAGIDIAIENGFLIQQVNLYNLYFKIYESLGNYKTALLYHKKYLDARDAISNVDIANRVNKLQFRAKSERIEKKMELVYKDYKINLLQLKNRQNLVYYFILTSIILLLLSLSNLKNFNYKIKLLKQFSFDASFKSKSFIIIVAGVYYTLFIFFFKPFGISEFTHEYKTFLILGYGVISMLYMAFNYMLFSFLERFFSDDKWDVRKYILFVVSFVLGIGFISWIYGAVVGISTYSLEDLYSVLIIICSIAIFPIYIIILFIEKLHLKKHVNTANVISHHLKNIEKPSDDVLIKITSDKSKEELQVLLSELICIEAKGNYSAIYFERKGEIKNKLLLMSLKSIETQLSEYKKIVRCHKSYIINVQKITKVTGNSQGYKLQIENLNFKIPVSRSFPKSILDSIKNKNM